MQIQLLRNPVTFRGVDPVEGAAQTGARGTGRPKTMLLTLTQFVVALFILLIAIASVLPLTAIRHGAIQGLDFPRIQYLFVALVVAVIAWFLFDGTMQWATWALCLFVFGLNAFFIAKFTPLWHRQSSRASKDLLGDRDRHIKILCANVKMSNRDYHRLVELVEKEDPDILIAL